MGFSSRMRTMSPARARTAPMVTEFSRPSGLPKASTNCPWRSSSESASVRGGKSFACPFNTERSVSSSTATTCALVMMYPSGSTMIPEPPPCGVSSSPEVERMAPVEDTPVVSTCTCVPWEDGETHCKNHDHCRKLKIECRPELVTSLKGTL